MNNIKSNPFPVLPRFVSLEIFKYLNLEDIPVCLMVNKIWNKFLIENSGIICKPLYDLCNQTDLGVELLKSQKDNPQFWRGVRTSQKTVIALFDRVFEKSFYSLLPGDKIKFTCYLPLQSGYFTFETGLRDREDFKKGDKRTINLANCIFIKTKSDSTNQDCLCSQPIGGVGNIGKGFNSRNSMYYQADFFGYNQGESSRLYPNSKPCSGMRCIVARSLQTNYLEKHLKQIQETINPAYSTIEPITVHYETVYGESLYIFGEGIGVFGLNHNGDNVPLNWKNGIPLHWTEGHLWTCKLGFFNKEEPFSCKIVLINDYCEKKWEIIDANPSKNRTMVPVKAMQIDNVCFQK